MATKVDMAKVNIGAREIGIVAVCLALAVALSIGLTLGLLGTTGNKKSGSVNEPSAYKTFRFAAITTDTNICSSIGVNIMAAKGGSVVDAAIASALCIGVVNAHSTGIGGGHFATIFAKPRDGSTKELVTLLSRERAPLLAQRDMYVDNPTASTLGGLAIGVPGQVMGFYTAWKRFGLLPWAELVQPAIDLCEKGFAVEKGLSNAIRDTESDIRSDPNLSELFVKADKTLVKIGDWIVNPKLGATFRAIQNDPMTFYNGSLARDIVDDISEYGGIITLEDLKAYTSSFKPPVSVSLANGNYRVFNPPPPSSGAVFDFIVNILDGYNFKPSDITANRVLTYHRIIEAFKFAYAKRSQLGDEDFVNVTQLISNLTSDDYAESIRLMIDDNQTHNVSFYKPTFDYAPDKGTAHLNVLGADSSAMAMTSTINLPFGSKVRGRRTGIIFNNEMDDFSTPGTVNAYGVPASPTNYIVPGKMPMSSMTPTLVLDQSGRVVFMTGAEGGTRITTQSAHVMMNSLWFDYNLQNATDMPRVHHQLFPNYINYEPNIDQVLLNGLKSKGHDTVSADSIAVVGSIRNRCGLVSGQCIEAVSDGRKGGSPDGY